MNEPGWHWWEFLNPFISASTAIVLGALGLIKLISARFAALDTKVETMNEALHTRMDAHEARTYRQEVSVATLIANELHYSRRLDHIEESVAKINEKQDEQMSILYEIKGKMPS